MYFSREHAKLETQKAGVSVPVGAACQDRPQHSGCPGNGHSLVRVSAAPFVFMVFIHMDCGDHTVHRELSVVYLQRDKGCAREQGQDLCGSLQVLPWGSPMEEVSTGMVRDRLNTTHHGRNPDSECTPPRSSYTVHHVEETEYLTAFSQTQSFQNVTLPSLLEFHLN